MMKCPLEISVRKWENNIGLDLKDIGWEVVG
jgi:hypothetical protein